MSFAVATVAATALACESQAGPDAVASRAVEVRAACITHEGGDLPAPTSQAPAGGTPPSAIQPACSASELDGTVCDALDAPRIGDCLARELAIWDGTLDRLVRDAVGTRRAAPVKSAVAAFRIYRDRTCAAYRAVGINPAGEDTVWACRVGETARFSKKLYEAVFSP